jgi:hypothetical protein
MRSILANIWAMISCNSLLNRNTLFDNVRNQNKFLSTIICVGGNTLSHVLPSSYKVLTNAKAVDGTTSDWFVIPVRA